MPSESECPIDTVSADCALCGPGPAEAVAHGRDFEYHTGPNTFTAKRCGKCRLVFLDPRPADSEMGRIYPDDYHAFQFDAEEFGFVHRVRRRVEGLRVMSWCRGLPPNAKILDVGCGDGFHLGLIRDFGRPGWKAEGIDLDARAVEAASRAGHVVRQGRVEELPLAPASYDLALMIMTVEHLADPVGVVAAVAKLLKPGGRLVVVTDNAASPDFELFGRRHWGGYHFPRHFQLFTKGTLAELGRRAGLTTQNIMTDYSPVNWVYSLRNRLVDRGASAKWVERFSLKSAPALAAFTILDIPFAATGSGAILRGTFRREKVLS